MNENTEKDSGIVIWGTRALGNTAFYYYKEKRKIVCYIDNDERKWGESLNGVKICPPDILKKTDADVVLAMNYGVEDVRKQLYEKYGIDSSVLFQIEESVCSLKDCSHTNDEIAGDTCIVSFSGGLGNQMFQYALLRRLEKEGKEVYGSLESYEHIGGMRFQLMDVFQNVGLKICTKEQKRQLLEINAAEKDKTKKFVIYRENAGYGGDRQKKADLSLLNITGGILTGTHQTYQFAEPIRETLLKDFAFDFRREEKLQEISHDIMGRNAVSVHIRRGDYLLEQNKWSYGGICTERYYSDAINYIRERTEHRVFYFFSNDMEWVREHFGKKEYNAVYIEASMFDQYQDWYDMYLMSICKHNIIANSTFSWWGAWLNQNQNKIVIAPQKWIHTFDYEDIYPSEWIKI